MTIGWALLLSSIIGGTTVMSSVMAGEASRCRTSPMVYRIQKSITSRVIASRETPRQPCATVSYYLDGVQTLAASCRRDADNAVRALEGVGCQTRLYPCSSGYTVVYEMDRRRSWKFGDPAEAASFRQQLEKLGFVTGLEQAVHQIPAASVTHKPVVSARTKPAVIGPPQVVLLPDDSLTAGVPGSGVLTIRDLREWLSNPANHAPLKVLLPTGLEGVAEQIVIPDSNPLTRAKIELGRQLFFDTRLSADNSVSCATCHHPSEGYSRRTSVAIGIHGQVGTRNSPVTFNRILSATQFWDGRSQSLEEQAIGPIENPIEMGNTHADAVRTLKAIPGYIVQFNAVFEGEGVTIENVGKALAAFERVLVTGPSSFDYAEQVRKLAPKGTTPVTFRPELLSPEVRVAMQEAQAHPMSDAAQRGRELFFGRAKCAQCHRGPNLTDEKFHNIGIGVDLPQPDLGRFTVTGRNADHGAFKTPTLRNVGLSAPYMHDGSLQTLEDVVEFYNRGGFPNAHLSPKITPLRLSSAEQNDLVAFLKSCTGRLPRVNTARLPAGL